MFKRKVITWYFVIVLMFTVLVVSFIGYASQKDRIQTLREDKLEEGFQSVLIFHLRATDRTNTPFGSGRNNVVDMDPYFSIMTPENQRSFKQLRPFDLGKWVKKSDGSQYFDCLYFAQVKSGEFMFNTVIFNIGASWMTNTPIKKSCYANPGELIYLGTFDVEFISADKNNFTHKSQINQNKTDLENDLKEFQYKCPKIYEKFKEQIKIASWKAF
jgi:hypothetical protein